RAGFLGRLPVRTFDRAFAGFDAGRRSAGFVTLAAFFPVFLLGLEVFLAAMGAVPWVAHQALAAFSQGTPDGRLVESLASLATRHFSRQPSSGHAKKRTQRTQDGSARPRSEPRTGQQTRTWDGANRR